LTLRSESSPAFQDDERYDAGGGETALVLRKVEVVEKVVETSYRRIERNRERISTSGLTKPSAQLPTSSGNSVAHTDPPVERPVPSNPTDLEEISAPL